MASTYNNNFTDELRARLSIVDIVGRRVPLTKKGQNYWGCCPFHNEKTPSFSVNEPKGFYHCFGCGEHGDIISFTMKSGNMDFKSAIAELANAAGLKLPDYKPRDAAVVAREESYFEIYDAAAKLFSQKLFDVSGSVALDYIRKRGLSDEVIKKYRLGFAPDGFNTMPARFANTKPENLLATGLVRRSEGGKIYDFFRNKLMFPITNSRGQIIAFSGRSLDGSEPKYINTSDTEFFHKRATIFGLSFARDAIYRANRSIVVEGQIDAIQMQTHGFSETVAPLGTALTAEHLQILAKHNRNIIFCFDGDNAGQKAAARAAALSMPFLRDNSDIRFAFMPAGMDPDEVLNQSPVASRQSPEMKTIIDSAVPIVDFLWELANKNYLVQTPGGRAAAEKFLNAEIEKITDPTLRNEYKSEYDGRKFNQWHKWSKSKVQSPKSKVIHIKTDFITKKTLENIAATHPELIEKNWEFLSKIGYGDLPNTAKKSTDSISKNDAEVFIVRLKLNNYLRNLENDLKKATDSDQIKNINAEIVKATERLSVL